MANGGGEAEAGHRRRRGKSPPNLALRNFRQARNLSQAKLAKLAKLSQSVIARLETGAARTTADVAARLAPILGRDPRDLFPPSLSRSEQRLAEPSPEPPPPGHTDPAVMRRALTVARRFGGTDDELVVEIAGLVYALLLRERDGWPISDDEGTLTLIEGFLRRLRRNSGHEDAGQSSLRRPISGPRNRRTQ
jgi:transcriptional regulator with XRE-family HTH domain